MNKLEYIYSGTNYSLVAADITAGYASISVTTNLASLIQVPTIDLWMFTASARISRLGAGGSLCKDILKQVSSFDATKLVAALAPSKLYVGPDCDGVFNSPFRLKPTPTTFVGVDVFLPSTAAAGDDLFVVVNLAYRAFGVDDYKSVFPSFKSAPDQGGGWHSSNH